MVKSRFSRIAVVLLCAVLSLMQIGLLVYHGGRKSTDVYMGSEYNCYTDYCVNISDFSWEYLIQWFDISTFILFVLLVVLPSTLPWVVWALRKHGFMMTWWRWILLACNVYYFMFFMGAMGYKAINTEMPAYDWTEKEAPDWFIYMSDFFASTCIASVLFMAGWIIYGVAKGIIRSVNRMMQKKIKALVSPSPYHQMC